jgi:hypothetical protein
MTTFSNWLLSAEPSAMTRHDCLMSIALIAMFAALRDLDIPATPDDILQTLPVEPTKPAEMALLAAVGLETRSVDRALSLLAGVLNHE